MTAFEPPRTWNYYACNKVAGSKWCFVKETARLVRFTGVSEDTIVPVLISEDENGEYAGWIDNHDVLSMVQPNNAFEMQFPGGSAEREAKGTGRKVHLRIEQISAQMEGRENVPE